MERPSRAAPPSRPGTVARLVREVAEPIERSTARISARCSSASATRGSCCSARRRTAPPSSTACARASRRSSIRTRGFAIVAVEADWPDARRVDRYVRRCRTGTVPRQPAVHALPDLDVAQPRDAGRFVEWLRAYNARGPRARAARRASTASTSTACSRRSRGARVPRARRSARRRASRASATAA